MNCPKCAAPNSTVRDSRPAEDGMAIRRRRRCEICDHKWTTFETASLPGNRAREATIRRVMQRLTAFIALVLIEEIGTPEDEETKEKAEASKAHGVGSQALHVGGQPPHFELR